MRKLLKYYAKNRLTAVGAITAICFIITTVFLISNDFIVNTYRYIFDIDLQIHVPVIYQVGGGNPFTTLTVLACILVFIIPIVEFYFKMRKISIDQMYALPITRNKLYLTKYLVGLAEIIIPITVCFIYTLIYIICSPHMLSLIYFLPFYFVLLIMSISTYTLFVFVYTRANTFFDGIINMILYGVLPAIIVFPLEFIWIKTNFINNFYIYSPIAFLTEIFNKLLVKESYISQGLGFTINFGYETKCGLIFYLIFTVICGILFFIITPKDKAEKSQEKSDSIFLYKTTIPIGIFFGSSIFGYDGLNVFLFPVMFIIGYLAYALYNRKIKPSLKFILMLVLTMIAGGFFGVVIYNLLHP